MNRVAALCVWSTVFFCVSIVACRKEPATSIAGIEQQAPFVTKGYHGDIRDCIEGVSLECGMLSFASPEQYQSVYECLEMAMDAHVAAFDAQYGNLDDEAYNDVADSLGFMEEQPLVTFEQALGFSSYRKKYDQLEQEWMDSGMDLNNDPDDTRCIADPIQGALLNENGAFMVGGVIYYLDAHCEWMTLDSMGCDGYNLCMTMPDSCQANKAFFYNDVGMKCYYNEITFAWDEPSNRRYKQRFEHTLTIASGYSFPIGQLVSIQKCYRKKFFVWWRYRAHQTMSTSGTAYKNDCESYTSVSGSVSDRRWRRVLIVDMRAPYLGLPANYPYFRECGVSGTFTNPATSKTLKLPSSCN